MDEVVLDGVKFVKAAVAAKQFRYTSDYVGQLCRAKKVNSRLVGRSWYVNIDSLKDYKHRPKTKPKVQVQVDDSNKPNETKTSRPVVLSVIGNKTAKSLVRDDFSKDKALVHKLTVSYEMDNEKLIPKLTKKHIKPPTTLRVDVAGSKKVNIKNKSKTSSFNPTPIPEVSLSGDLSLTSYPDFVEPETVLTESSDGSKNIAKSPDLDPNADADSSIKPQDDLLNEIKSSHSLSEVVVKTKSKRVSKTDAKIPESTTSEKEGLTMSSIKVIEPESKQPLVTSFSPASIKKKSLQHVSTLTLMSPLIATIMALVCVLLIMSAVGTVIVSDSSQLSGVELQIDNLLDLMHY